MSQDGLIYAPFSDEQVNALNAFQLRGDFHSFTCGNHSGHRDLVATRDGWICEDCDYRQNWAHAFMAAVRSATPEVKPPQRCPTCKSRERDPRHALATDSKELFLCEDSWHEPAVAAAAVPDAAEQPASEEFLY